jgi:hypothetical protein
MHAEGVKDSNNVRSISENCVLFICLLAALTVRYKFLTYLICLLEGTGAEQRKMLNFATCCLYVIELLRRTLGAARGTRTGECGETNVTVAKRNMDLTVQSC